MTTAAAFTNTDQRNATVALDPLARTKSHSLGVRLNIATKIALEKAASADQRSLSSLVEKILTEWLENSTNVEEWQRDAADDVVAKQPGDAGFTSERIDELCCDLSAGIDRLRAIEELILIPQTEGVGSKAKVAWGYVWIVRDIIAALDTVSDKFVDYLTTLRN